MDGHDDPNRPIHGPHHPSRPPVLDRCSHFSMHRRHEPTDMWIQVEHQGLRRRYWRWPDHERAGCGIVTVDWQVPGTSHKLDRRHQCRQPQRWQRVIFIEPTERPGDDGRQGRCRHPNVPPHGCGNRDIFLDEHGRVKAEAIWRIECSGSTESRFCRFGPRRHSLLGFRHGALFEGRRPCGIFHNISRSIWSATIQGNRSQGI